MTKYERIQAAIPTDNDWTLTDLEAKAEELGTDRNKFVLRAVNLLMNFDKEFLDYIEGYSKGLKIPEYMVIQNMIINRMADERGKKAAWAAAGGTVPGGILKEFIQVIDNKGPRTLTGSELLKVLEEKAQREERHKIKEFEKEQEYYKNLE